MRYVRAPSASKSLKIAKCMRTKQDKLITPSRVSANDYPMSGKFMLRRFANAESQVYKLHLHMKNFHPTRFVYRGLLFFTGYYFALAPSARSNGEAARTRHESEWK